MKQYIKNNMKFFIHIVPALLLIFTLGSCDGGSGGGDDEMTNADAVSQDKAALAITYATGDSGSSVTTHMALPTTGPNCTTVTWASGNETVVTAEGTVRRPAYGNGNATVVLSATVSRGDASETGTFTLTVIEQPATDAEAVAEDAEKLVITYAAGDSVSHVTRDLTLPSSGSNGCTVTWTSSQPSVIAADGTVTQSIPSGDNEAVRLTATIEKGAALEFRVFDLTVISCEPGTPVVTFGNRNLLVTWAAVEGATAYEIYYNTADDPSTATRSGGDIPGTSHTVTGLTNGTLYYVWIKAKNAAGTSGFSQSARETPRITFENAVLKDKVPCYADDGAIVYNMVYVLNAAMTFPTDRAVGTEHYTSLDDVGTVRTLFFMGETEVTYALWYEVRTWAVDSGIDHDGDGITGDDMYTFANAGSEGGTQLNTGKYGPQGTPGAAPTDAQNEPVVFITWRDAIVWCNALTEYYNARNGGAADLACVYHTDENYTTPLRVATNSNPVDTTPGSQDCPYIYAAAPGNTGMAGCTAKGFRLPTSDEWEYAARYIGTERPQAGDLYTECIRRTTYPISLLTYGYYWTPGTYASGATADVDDDDATGAVAWYTGNSADYANGIDNKTHDVATKQANQLGLYDMSGNVSELCFDNSPDYCRLYRGGHFGSSSDLEISKSYYSYYTSVFFRDDWEFTWQYASCIGFRFARNR